MGLISLTITTQQSIITQPLLSSSLPSINKYNNNNNLYSNSYHPKFIQLNTLSGYKYIKLKKNIKIKASKETTNTNMSSVIEKLGVIVETNPNDSRLSQLGVFQWPKWGCAPSKFPWTYEAKETCYLLQGKVKVYADGSDEAVEFGAGDLVIFPKGMKCTWDVSEAVDKHYKFE